jgi:hypothetical protein
MPLSNLLPKHRIHLLGGASDAGKTSFILPAMVKWSPNWVYVSGDRSILDALDKFTQLGLPPGAVPLIPAYGRDSKSWRVVVEQMETMEPRPEYVVFEGFQRQCRNHNRPNDVFEFLGEIDSYLQPTQQFPNGLTFIGITESPKQKPKDRYPDPRQRISGCSAWASHASTVFLLEPLDKDTTGIGPGRQLWVCQKNAPRQCHFTQFTSNGLLVFPNL